MPKLAGRYEVQDLIGQGAMAEVVRAYDPSINRPLAIKILKDEVRAHAPTAARFLREATAAGGLSHPNIVTVYDVGELDGYPYIVMELLDGEPLDAVLRRDGQLDPERAMAIALQLADALAYAHAQGVVHRDIKPSNIIVGRDGRSVKIVDFGIARVAQEGELEEDDSLKTQIGQVLGTPRYMSPEQALGREIDGRSDLFSMGAILYEMLTGKRAFQGANAATLALQITQQDPTPISALAPDVPKGLQHIVGKLLAKRPEKRFTDGGQLADALRRELGVMQAIAGETGRVARRLPLQARMTLLIATVTALVLMVGASLVLARQDAVMRRLALTSGSTMASFVATNAALAAADNAGRPVERQDWLPVEAFVKAAASDPNVQQLIVVDAQGVIRAASDPARVGLAYISTPEQLVERRGDMTVTAGASGFRFVRPIIYAGREFGMVDVSVSRADLNAASRLSRLLMLGLGAVTLAAVVAASFVLTRLMAKPIRRLKDALDDAALGDLDFRLSHQRKDEFGELFDGFNRFAQAMQERLEAAGAPPRAEGRPRLEVAGAADAEPQLDLGLDADLEKTRIAGPIDEADRTIIRAAG